MGAILQDIVCPPIVTNAQLGIQLTEQTGHAPNNQEPDLSVSKELMNQFKQDMGNDKFIQARIKNLENGIKFENDEFMMIN